MLPSYPHGQNTPGQHPKYPNIWSFSSITTAEDALERAHEFINDTDMFILDSYTDDVHINLLRDNYILSRLKEFISTDYKVNIFVNDKWQPWEGDLTPHCITAIRIFL